MQGYIGIIEGCIGIMEGLYRDSARGYIGMNIGYVGYIRVIIWGCIM